MIRLFIALALLLGTGAAPDGTPATVKEIRQAYADAQEKMAMSLQEGMHRNDIETTLRYVVPAVGETIETLRCFYDQDMDTEAWEVRYYPYFITCKYTVSVLHFYEEYLFDAPTGRLLFFFRKSDQYEGGTYEERYYFGPDGRISEIIKGERTLSDETILRRAETFRSSIRSLVENAANH